MFHEWPPQTISIKCILKIELLITCFSRTLYSSFFLFASSAFSFFFFFFLLFLFFGILFRTRFHTRTHTHASCYCFIISSYSIGLHSNCTPNVYGGCVIVVAFFSSSHFIGNFIFCTHAALRLYLPARVRGREWERDHGNSTAKKKTELHRAFGAHIYLFYFEASSIVHLAQIFDDCSNTKRKKVAKCKNTFAQKKKKHMLNELNIMAQIFALKRIAMDYVWAMFK